MKFTRQDIFRLSLFIVINMVVATVVYLIWDYNVYWPLLAGAFGGFFGGRWFKPKIKKQ